MNSTSETPLLNGMNNVPISSNNINLSNGRPLLANTTDPVQPRFKRAGIIGRIKNMVKELPHEERRFEKLVYAIYNNNIDEIKRLLTTGINVNKVIDPKTISAVSGLRTENMMIRLMDAIEGSVFDRTPELFYGSTPLLLACAIGGNPNTVSLLLEAGANPNIANKRGMMPIHYAAIRNFTDIIKLLVEAGVSIEVKDNEGQTPLHHATNRNSVNAVQFLLEAGTNPNTVNIYNRTPLHIAASYNKRSDELAKYSIVNNTGVTKLLLDAGANTEVKDTKGKTPLDYAYNPELRALLEKTKGGSRKSRKSKKNKKRKTRRS